ncbi:hypothetical protein Tco_1387369 [Tanacetum coccineum]
MTEVKIHGNTHDNYWWCSSTLRERVEVVDELAEERTEGYVCVLGYDLRVVERPTWWTSKRGDKEGHNEGYGFLFECLFFEAPDESLSQASRSM